MEDEKKVTKKVVKKAPAKTVVSPTVEAKIPSMDPAVRKKLGAKLNFMKKRVVIAQNEAAVRVPKNSEPGTVELARKNVTLYSKEIAELESLLK